MVERNDYKTAIEAFEELREALINLMETIAKESGLYALLDFIADLWEDD